MTTRVADVPWRSALAAIVVLAILALPIFELQLPPAPAAGAAASD